MSALKTLINLFLKDLLKKSGSGKGITSLKNLPIIKVEAESQAKDFIAKALESGIDLNKIPENRIRYIFELSQQGKSKTLPEALARADIRTKGEVVDLTGKTIQPGETIVGGKGFKIEMSADDYAGFKEEWFSRIMANEDDAINTFLKRGINQADERFINLSKNQRKDFLDMVEYRLKHGNEKFMNDFTDAKGVFNKFPKKENGIDWKKVEETDLDEFAYGGIAGMLGEPTYADGGRTGFKGKKFDPKRRTVLKGLGALAAIPFIGKYFKWAKPLAKSSKILTQVPIENAAGMPVWFPKLVNRVIKEGEDITQLPPNKGGAFAEREIVHSAKLGEGQGVRVTQNLDNQTISVEYHSVDNMGGIDDAVRLEYKAAEEIATKKGSVKTKPTFEAEEAWPHGTTDDYKDITMEGSNVVTKVDDLYSDTSALKQFGTNKTLSKKELEIAKQKRKRVNEINNDLGEQSQLLPEPPLPDDYPFASGGRVPLAGGGILKLLKLFKKKPETLKEFIERRNFLKGMIGNTDNMKNKRILQEILEETENVKGFEFPESGVGSDIHKEIEMILNKDVTKHATGGRVPLFAGSIAKLGKFTKSEILIKMLEKTLKGSKDSWSKTNLPNFIKELKAKPELANDPKVWNFFTNKLPKNQRLVVHSDDTVDLWSQSEFGPHNIKTTDKFIKKHPHLSRDEAVKIQNMEPEDQILEMKRLETIRNRTTNATGGRVSLSNGGLAGMLGE